MKCDLSSKLFGRKEMSLQVVRKGWMYLLEWKKDEVVPLEVIRGTMSVTPNGGEKGCVCKVRYCWRGSSVPPYI